MKRSIDRFLWLASFVLSSCAPGPTPVPWRPSTTSTASAGSPDASTSTAPGDLPCDVANLLDTRCTPCHSNPPLGAPESVASYADLTRASRTDPSRTVAELAVARMQSSTSPMPPAPAPKVSAAEVAVLQSWIDAGMPPGSCGAQNPYDTPTICSTGRHWTGGNEESSRMRPGGACIACHRSGEGPWFSLAGTVYASAHEPNDCAGGPTGGGSPTVEITDATGQVTSLSVNSAGNFFSRQRIALPYTARVLLGGRARTMLTPQRDGDCNGCHTERGTNGAPGRVVLP